MNDVEVYGENVMNDEIVRENKLDSSLMDIPMFLAPGEAWSELSSFVKDVLVEKLNEKILDNRGFTRRLKFVETHYKAKTVHQRHLSLKRV
ncbi:hypothetical protein TNCV_1031331 [Trichonephila clavipes]|nr:hypothetical protein TNCV_1031331 [Trichonephila clavipes]